MMPALLTSTSDTGEVPLVKRHTLEMRIGNRCFDLGHRPDWSGTSAAMNPLVMADAHQRKASGALLT
jgi:hypothetical protein